MFKLGIYQKTNISALKFVVYSEIQIAFTQLEIIFFNSDKVKR